MRITFVLNKQQVYRLIKAHWKVQRKIVPQETYALEAAKSQGLDVVDANAVIADVEEKQRINIVGLYDLKPPIGENHPLYHKETCYIFRDNNVLLQGLDQALVLTNSVFIDGLPSQVESHADDEYPSEDNFVQRCIKSTFLYDAEQKKLPVYKDPKRPAWTFPRMYGVTDKRRNRLLCNRLLQLCSMSNNKLHQDRCVMNNSMFSVPLVIDENNVQLEVGADMLLTSSCPLPSLADPASSTQYTVPNIYPLHPLVSFQESNIYKLQNIFPLKPGARCSHIHTAIIHYNETEVKNLYETEVTDSQVLSRSLVKSYAMAVAQARHTFGSAVEELQTPITVQTIQTDGQMFIFSILQLNTLLHTGNIHNLFWSTPILQLFSQCEYINGKPVLKEYNPEIYRRMLSFYNTDQQMGACNPSKVYLQEADRSLC